MVKTKPSILDWLFGHALILAVVLSLTLLVVAGNLESPRWWLVVPGWIILGICIAVVVDKTPKDSPYKSAFALPALAGLFYFGIFQGALRTLLQLLFQPSGEHLFNFVFNRGFMLLVILYLAGACLFYGMKLREHQKNFDSDKTRIAVEARETKLTELGRRLSDVKATRDVDGLRAIEAELTALKEENGLGPRATAQLAKIRDVLNKLDAMPVDDRVDNAF